MRQQINQLADYEHEHNVPNDVVLKELEGMENLTQMEIGEVNFSINVTSKTSYLLQEHDLTYRGFINKENNGKNKSAGAIDIKVNLELGKFPDTGKLTKIFDSNQSWSMFREGDIYWAVLHPLAHKKPIWTAQFNRDIKEVTVFTSGQLIQGRDGKTIMPNPVRYPLDQLLIMYILARRQGAVIHAAGIEMNGKGFIFAGPSGAGKSTLARLFNTSSHQNNPGAAVLSDERIVARKINGMFKAYGTPWHGEEAAARNKCLPLSGIFFLNHGKENTVTPLNPQQALDKLLKVISIPWYDRDVMSEVLCFCEDLLTHVPLFELHFTPGLEVVSFLETRTRDILIKKSGYAKEVD